MAISWDTIRNMLAAIWNCILYLLDVGLDFNTLIIYFNDTDYVWFTLSLFFIIGPIILTALYWSYLNRGDRRGWDYAGMSLIWILLSPVLPIVGLADGMCYGQMESVMFRVGIILLLEIIFEAYPQASLQSYAIGQTYLIHDIGLAQILSPVVSITALAWGLSSNDILFKDTKKRFRAVFFICGFVSIASRIFVCTLFSLIHKGLWFVPFGIELGLSVSVWLVRKFSTSPYLASYGIAPLAEDTHDRSFATIVCVSMTWMVNYLSNSYTTSSIPIALTNLLFAIIGFFFVPQTIGIVGICLCAVNFSINVVLIIPNTPLLAVGKAWREVKIQAVKSIYGGVMDDAGQAIHFY